MNLLEHDHFIAQIVRFTGVLVFAYSTMCGLTYTRPQPADSKP